MKASEITLARLHNQHLLGEKLSTPKEVVNHLGAVQSQDFAAAKWGIGIRLKNPSLTQVEEAFDKGEILRTHMMRPTWHFVTPEDIHSVLNLTSSRVLRFNAHMHRETEIDENILKKSQKIIMKSLAGKNFLTRTEISKRLGKEKIKATGQRLAYILMYSELDGLIVSGPRIGKQFTYALLSERAPKPKIFDREKALKDLTFKYFNSHGPAQIKDFSWWSGLTTKDAQAGIELCGSKIMEETVEGKQYFFMNNGFAKPKGHTAFLLSIYDEYVISYKDRSLLGGEKLAESLIRMGNALTAVLVLDGQIAGTWKRSIKMNDVDIKISFLKKITKEEMYVINLASQNYADFLNLKRS